MTVSRSLARSTRTPSTGRPRTERFISRAQIAIQSEYKRMYTPQTQGPPKDPLAELGPNGHMMAPGSSPNFDYATVRWTATCTSFDALVMTPENHSWTDLSERRAIPLMLLEISYARPEAPASSSAEPVCERS